jgi:hypothetical protein
MAKDTYGKRKYKCSCGAVAEEFVWDSDIEKFKFSCKSCSKKLGYEQLYKQKKVQAAAIRTETKNR